jgi:hypothetical protein
MAPKVPQWVTDTLLRIQQQAAGEQSDSQHLVRSHERILRSRATLKHSERQVRNAPRRDTPA